MPSIFINRDKVVFLLIKERCKLADKQSRIDQKNEFITRRGIPNKGNSFISNSIYNIFPPRAKWCSIGNTEQRIKLNSIERNELRLKYTYLKAKKRKCKDEWYIKLCNYADYIVKISDNMSGIINPPTVTVIEKKRDDKTNTIIYRPVCSFPREIKIIFSLLNKYLTKVLDKEFYGCSYAFRAVKRKYELQHLNAVIDIQQYRKNHSGLPLYVAECDMQKFYDTIDHNIIKQRFSTLLNNVVKTKSILKEDVKKIKSIFYTYVDCFDFRKDIFIHNKKSSNDIFWHKKNSDKLWKCKIEWVSELEHAKKFQRRKKVGVPQGGALSGLIANIVMHYVDVAVHKSIEGSDTLYCRFCDDMILIGVDKNKVMETFNIYQNAIHNSKLFSHNLEAFKFKKMKDFWNGKTRGPYEWNERGENVFPWITFVGFDINWCGNLRIRKASFKKHIAKQYNVASDLLLPYKNGKIPRYSMGTIKLSLINRLICMSVGRIKIWNYKSFDNNCSWIKAFSILDKNQWSVKQMKCLDKHRGVIINRASKQLKCFECPSNTKSNIMDDFTNRYMYFGGPFSYYGQCFIYK